MPYDGVAQVRVHEVEVAEGVVGGTCLPCAVVEDVREGGVGVLRDVDRGFFCCWYVGLARLAVQGTSRAVSYGFCTSCNRETC